MRKECREREIKNEEFKRISGADKKKQGSLQCQNSCCKGREFNVSYCDSDEISIDGEILTYFGEKEDSKKKILVDSGSPVTNCGEKWMMKYLELYGIDYSSLTKRPCHQKSMFGSSKYISEEIVEVPITMKQMKVNMCHLPKQHIFSRIQIHLFCLGRKL